MKDHPVRTAVQGIEGFVVPNLGRELLNGSGWNVWGVRDHQVHRPGQGIQGGKKIPLKKLNPVGKTQRCRILPRESHRPWNQVHGIDREARTGIGQRQGNGAAASSKIDYKGRAPGLCHARPTEGRAPGLGTSSHPSPPASPQMREQL
jgi:hypothetical protein